MLTTLIGGGRDADRIRPLLARFVKAVDGGKVACVMVDEADGVDAERWHDLLQGISEIHDVVLNERRTLLSSDLRECKGVFVAGGLTPLYARLVVPAAAVINDLPYAGFSAGAAIAAERAIVGGWRNGDREICSEDASEDLERLTIQKGLGRVKSAIDVHATQWGTPTRALHAVRTGHVQTAIAIDEHTALHADKPHANGASTLSVEGAGSAYRITPGQNDRLTVEILTE